MNKRLRIIIPVAVVVVAAVIWNLAFNRSESEGRIRLSGNIDVTQVDLAFKIPGRLSRRLVDEGDRVGQGQRLAVLDDTDQRLRLQKASADVDYASSVLAELSAGSRPEEIQRAQARVSQARFALNERQRGSRVQEVAEAEADLQRAVADERTAQSQLELARANFNRYEAVYKEGGISRQAFDTYRSQRVAAQNAAEAAASRRQAAAQRLSLRREGSRSVRPGRYWTRPRPTIP